MTGIGDLYPVAVLEHSRHPRNRRTISGCTHAASGENPACGDEVRVFLVLDVGGIIDDVAFEGKSCAIATASASLMTEVLPGKTGAQARALFDRFHAMATGGAESPPDEMEAEVERLGALSALRDYPVREKCATLAWHAMLAALESAGEGTSASGAIEQGA